MTLSTGEIVARLQLIHTRIYKDIEQVAKKRDWRESEKAALIASLKLDMETIETAVRIIDPKAYQS